MGRKSVLVPAAIEVLRQYNSRVTIRQLYYRLLSKGIIKNSISSYNTLIRELVKARRDGRIPYEAFEDRTRHSIEGAYPNPQYDDEKDLFKSAIETYENSEEDALESLKCSSRDYGLPFWWEQPIYTEVWVEKQALNNLFEPITEKYRVTFVPCRGYPSLSLLYDCSKRLRIVPSYRKIHILYFGDFDVRGINIMENIDRSLNDEFGIRANLIRYALTKEQIDQYQLPPAPTKKTDTMARGWIETQGDVAWELDALEPNILEAIIENTIKEQINFDVLKNREETIRENREWIQLQVSEYLAEQGLGDV